MLTVRIPEGVEEQTALWVPGHGLPADKPGRPAISTSWSAQRPMRGLSATAAISTASRPSMLLTRCSARHFDIPTLDGPATVKVAPGTQPETMLRLRGKGLPQFGGGSRGDLYFASRCTSPSGCPITTATCSSSSRRSPRRRQTERA